MEYSLDLENLHKIPFDKYEKDFTFIVNGKSFCTTRFVADLLSPVIRRAHYQDSSFNKYIINNENITEELTECPLEEYFSEFLEVGNFNRATIDATRLKYYSAYFYSVGNVKEYFRLENKYFKEISKENVIKRLKMISKIMKKFPEEESCETISEKLIQFASENFEEIEKEELSSLECEELEHIIRNEHLKIENEDSLMKFILNKYEANHEYSKLFEFVIFANLSEKVIQKFIEIFNIEYLDLNTWKSICRRLSLSCIKMQEESTRYLVDQKKFEFDSNNKFNGILKYLSDQTQGNIAENGTIEITSNISSNVDSLKNMVNFENTNYYIYNNENSMANISFNFKDRSIKVTNYSIQTGTYDANGGHLKSWVIEGFDGEKWDELDRRENDSSLNGNSFSSSFEVQHKLNKFYKSIRLRQTGKTWYQDKYYRIEIMRIEFYGTLKEKSTK